MPNVNNLKTWESIHEFHPSNKESYNLRQIHLQDEEIGSVVSARYGKKQVIPELSSLHVALNFIEKVVRKSVLELNRTLGRLLLSFLGRIQRVWNKHISNSLRLNYESGDRVEIDGNGSFAEVVSLDSLTLTGRLKNTQATYWILCREPNQLLRKAVPHIIDSIKSSQPDLILGDCRNISGVRIVRPNLDKLLLRQVDYLGPVQVVKVKALREAVSNKLHNSLWPLAVALSSKEDEITYLPEVLGVGKQNYEFSDDICAEVSELVEQNLIINDSSATVNFLPPGKLHVRYSLQQEPLVSIILPSGGTTIDGKCFLVNAVRSIISRSTYQRYELVIVADNHLAQEVIDEVEKICSSNVRWIRYSENFNFSKKVNLGAVCARGEYLLFLNDDVEVVSPDWIQSMLSLINVEKIGYVGALLFFGDQTIQHAGHIYEGGARHEGFGQTFMPLEIDQFYSNDCIREGVTAACSIISKQLFISAGGFTELLPGNFNDVDFSLKIAELGYKSAVSGGARLYHFESKSRDPRVQKAEADQLLSRWEKIIST